MKSTANNKQTIATLAYSLGAAVVEEDIPASLGHVESIDQDYWGSSMSFDAVREGRIFGAFGVARGASLSEDRQAGVAA